MDLPVTKLAPEILLKIFELTSQDGDAALVSSILCCKQWRRPAESVLYGDVFLNAHRLTKFLDTYSDRKIRSLTVVMDPVPVDPYDPTLAVQTATARLEALQRLRSHIKKMGLISLSITIDFPFPYTASLELSSIINNLPKSCTCLEIDVEHSGFILGPTPPTSHVCDAIRTILPQLEHLRLRRPQLCSALFGHEQDAGFEAVRATNLKSCLINLSLREPTGSSSSGSRAAPCGYPLVPHIGVMHDFPSTLNPLLLARLQEFSRLNSAHLERLWILDVQTRDPTVPNSWAAWVRRDILSNTSVPIPIANIGGFRNDAWLARIPTDSGHGAEDWVSSPERLEALAEGRSWSQTTSGIRLPTLMLREYDCVPWPLTKELFLKKHRLTCVLWQNEEATGAKLLPQAPGPLMEVWDLRERTPRGWTRDSYQGSPMVQERDILMDSFEHAGITNSFS
ncbi:hypothetical protein CFD26_101499 [Aspergillus turcosus]|uniref:F-box domain-containing protein n=1 Tax=Aspergillus turcosus TaxID=1245748 RepID=A0A421CTQ1_9EURO|nr:hypothetical protein CFD26_101499 [Aspergillus turcosus]